MQPAAKHLPPLRAESVETPWFRYRDSVVEANYFAARILGLTPESLVGRSFDQISFPNQPDGSASNAVSKQRFAAARAGLPQSFIWHFRYGVGSVQCLVEIRWEERSQSFDCRFVRVGDSGSTERFFVDNRSYLQDLLDFATSLVYVRDPDGRFVFANRAFLELVGLDEFEIIGRRPAEFMDARSAAVLDHDDEEVMTNLVTVQREETIHTLDGSPRTFIAIKYPIFSRESGLHALTSIAMDITARKRTENALRNVALNITSVTGQNVLDQLARLLAESIDASLTFIGRYDEFTRRMVTLAVCFKGESLENFDYELADTPCSRVFGRDFEYIPGNVAARYPGDGMLKDLSIESYAGYPLFDSNGVPIGIIAALNQGPMPDRDVTETLLKIYAVRAAAEIERISVERSLARSEEQYRSIFAASLDGLALWTPNERLIDANPAFARMVGYSTEELREIDPAELVAENSREDYAQFNRAASEGRPHSCELEMVRRDGGRFVADVRGVGIRYQGRPHYLTIGRDITEQRERERALVHSKDRLRRTVESALDCIVCMSADGTISEFNPAAERCFGYRRDEVIGRPLSELIIPERHRAAHEAGLSRFLRDRSSRYVGKRVLIEALRSDGSEFPVELSVSVATQGGADIFIGYLRDLSEQVAQDAQREKLEMQLRQAQKMEAIGHLAGGIAHDCNNLLTSLIGYSSMARDRLQQLGDPKALNYLDKSLRSGQRARDLIQQLLTFSRGQRGERQCVDLAALLREFLPLLESTLPSSVQFLTRYDEGVAPVMVDPVQVEQVLMNLCINARDAMNGSGEILISLRQRVPQDIVCSSCLQSLHGSHVELSVRDTGPGIDAEIMQRMFEPFYSTKAVGKGSGMGLSMVHGIVHDHGGHIVFENPAQGGAEFRVLFPAHAATENFPGASGQGLRGGSPRQMKGRLLLVDDDHGVLEFMRELLESWGLEVSAFDDPAAACAAIEHGDVQFDLAIVDQVMRGMTGVALSRWLKGRDRALPVVLYSGFSGELAEAEIEAAGIDAMLSKPVDPARLFDLLVSLSGG